MSIPDWIGPAQRGETRGSPASPLLLARGGEDAARVLPAGKAGLRLEGCASSGRALGKWGGAS
jgi:hypothetical protein